MTIYTTTQPETHTHLQTHSQFYICYMSHQITKALVQAALQKFIAIIVILIKYEVLSALIMRLGKKLPMDFESPKQK